MKVARTVITGGMERRAERHRALSLPTGLWVEMDRYLEQHHPERFREIQEKYDGQLEEIGKKISELEQMDA
jgi:hypothetical protein